MNKLILPLLFISPFAHAAENLYDSSRTPIEGTTYGLPSDIKKNAEFFDKLIGFAVETKTSALILIKDDKLILEKYWDLDPEQTIRLHSVTKSILSLGIGKLVDDNRISLSDPAKKWFVDWGGEKQEITLQQLMNQTSGYPESNDENIKGTNRLKLSLDQKIVDKPGAKFAYSNMGSWLVGEILHQASKKPVDQYMNENFFSSMGIQKWSWDKDETQNLDTSSGLWMTARDLTKFGRLLLNRGKWGSDRLISEKYLDQMTTPNTERAKAYGLLWWLDGDNYYARGDFGQILAVYPKEKVILVRLKKTEIKGHEEGSALPWEKRAKQLGHQLQSQK